MPRLIVPTAAKFPDCASLAGQQFIHANNKIDTSARVYQVDDNLAYTLTVPPNSSQSKYVHLCDSAAVPVSLFFGVGCNCMYAESLRVLSQFVRCILLIR